MSGSGRVRRVQLPGVQFAVTLDRELEERIRNNPAYKRVAKPVIDRIRQRNDAMPSDLSPRPVKTPTPPPEDSDANELWQQISKIPWYHTIELRDGVITPGFVDHRPHVDYYGLPDDMSGLRCLDLGTFDGFWAFEMERRGAAEVVALDLDNPDEFDVPDKFMPDWRRFVRARRDVPMSAGFSLVHEVLGSKVKRHVLNLYALSPEEVGQFDVVFISDVLVHLRDTPTILERMRRVTRGIAIVGEAFDPVLDEHEKTVSEFMGAQYPHPFMWWMHSSRTLAKIMSTAGFDPVETVSRFQGISRDGPFWKVSLKGHVAPTLKAG